MIVKNKYFIVAFIMLAILFSAMSHLDRESEEFIYLKEYISANEDIKKEAGGIKDISVIRKRSFSSINNDGVSYWYQVDIIGGSKNIDKRFFIIKSEGGEYMIKLDDS